MQAMLLDRMILFRIILISLSYVLCCVGTIVITEVWNGIEGCQAKKRVERKGNDKSPIT